MTGTSPTLFLHCPELLSKFCLLVGFIGSQRSPASCHRVPNVHINTSRIDITCAINNEKNGVTHTKMIKEYPILLTISRFSFSPFFLATIPCMPLWAIKLFVVLHIKGRHHQDCDHGCHPKSPTDGSHDGRVHGSFFFFGTTGIQAFKSK